MSEAIKLKYRCDSTGKVKSNGKILHDAILHPLAPGEQPTADVFHERSMGRIDFSRLLSKFFTKERMYLVTIEELPEEIPDEEVPEEETAAPVETTAPVAETKPAVSETAPPAAETPAAVAETKPAEPAPAAAPAEPAPVVTPAAEPAPAAVTPAPAATTAA